MPKIQKLVEQELSHAELNAELAKFAAAADKNGAFLTNEDGSQGEKIVKGDCLIPNEPSYAAGAVARDSHVVVHKVIDEAGIVLGAYLQPSGAMGVQFFHPNSFVGKHIDGPVKGTVQKRVAKKKVT